MVAAGRHSILLIFALALITGKAAAFCFEEAGAVYGISPVLLQAIAKVESSMNPLAINRNTNGSYDYGLMQINSSWHDTLGRDSWLMLSDPCFNAHVGAWILSQCIGTYGYTWEAVGCYNATKPQRRKAYAWKVRRQLAQLDSVKEVNGVSLLARR